MMKRVSLKDIARKVGVSTSTVSFVLNGKAKHMRISEALSDKIIATAEKEGYYPNPIAVSLRTGKTKTLGLMVETISGSFFASLAKFIEDEAAAFGYKIFYCSTENNDRKGRELITMLSKQQVDGYLITPTAGMEKEIKELIHHKRPVVLIDSYFPDLNNSYVLVDNFAGVMTGMKYLFEKGLSRIGFVTVDLQMIQVQERYRAYRQAFEEQGLTFDSALTLKIRYGCPEKDAVEQIVQFIGAHRDMEVLFFATNYLGVNGLKSIKELGLRIPTDIKVICFDDKDIFELYPPGITTIQQPIEAIGRTAIRLLMDEIGNLRNGIADKQVKIEGKLIVRASV